jgi:hypothetical protein
MFAQINGNTNIFFQFDAIGYSKSPVLERMIIIKISISYDTYGSEKGTFDVTKATILIFSVVKINVSSLARG